MSKLDVEYRAIDGFPNYRVGNDGSVWSKTKSINTKRKTSGEWHQLKTISNPSGHQAIKLGSAKRQYVHIIVAEAFLDPSDRAALVRHIDGDPANNRSSNLAYGSYQDNYDDFVGHVYSEGTGRASTRTKLTPDMVLEILKMVQGGVSQSEAARRFGVRHPTVHKILAGQRWSTVTGIGRNLIADSH